MEDIIRKISNGKAILFVGAGFSKSGKNISGDETLPLAANLANLIGSIGKFEDGGDLKFAADYFLNVCCQKDKTLTNTLIEKLKDVFTIKEPHEDHKWVMKVPWKRIYTTNYDDLVEVAARSIGKRIETVSIDDPTENFSSEKICVHVNGSITDLDSVTINNKFKLSHSSYLSSENFIESNWNYIFRKDLELSSCIVFIGYSLYDIDIEKILYENPTFRNKVIFIERENTNGEDITRKDYIYNKYGNVYRIGLSGIASLIREKFEIIISATEEFYTEAFTRYQIGETPEETIREKEIESFLRHGELSTKYIQEGMTSSQTVPFLIKRSKIDYLVNLIKANQIVCVTSELGNGKTFFLEEAALQLTLEGNIVYTITDKSGNAVSDVNKILSKNINCILVIDNYGNHKDLLKYLLSINLKSIKLLLSERTPNHHSYCREFDNKLNTKDLSIDILDENEIEFLVKILEHTSLWGSYGKYSNRQKLSHIRVACKSQLSAVLIDVLKSSQIKNEIKKLLSKTFENEQTKLNIFVICLLDVMNIPVTLSLISEISGNDIALSKFSNSNEIRHFFTLNMFEMSINTKSSIYSLYLLNEHFEPNYLIDKCLVILQSLERKFVKSRNLDYTRNDIRTNLFRFNFVEKILPISTKTGMLVKYFEEIKNILPFHINNPQYWLQYGMAHMAMSNYDLAERYLGNAYDKAKFRDDYDTHKINNQKARLNIKIASLASTGIDEAFKLFIEADNLLSKNDNDVYKFKIVYNYSKFYNAKRNTLSKTQRSKFRQACENKLKDLRALQNFDSNNFKQEIVYRDCEDQLLRIIQEIG